MLAERLGTLYGRRRCHRHADALQQDRIAASPIEHGQQGFVAIEGRDHVALLDCDFELAVEIAHYGAVRGGDMCSAESRCLNFKHGPDFVGVYELGHGTPAISMSPSIFSVRPWSTSRRRRSHCMGAVIDQTAANRLGKAIDQAKNLPGHTIIAGGSVDTERAGSSSRPSSSPMPRTRS